MPELFESLEPHEQAKEQNVSKVTSIWNEPNLICSCSELGGLKRTWQPLRSFYKIIHASQGSYFAWGNGHFEQFQP